MKICILHSYWFRIVVACTFLIAFFSGSLQASIGVITQHNDNARTGSNTGETILTPSTVSSGHFGKLFTLQLDANVNGQTLYVPNLTINGKVHNVLFAYTSNNVNYSPCSVYAFDADSATNTSPLWRLILPNSAEWTTTTPVIDVSSKTLYLVSKDNYGRGATRLRAINIITGKEEPGSGYQIKYSVVGTGDGSSNDKVEFDTTHANCRPALLLLSGNIYIAFAHNSDSFPYHGWIFCYHYDGTTFHLLGHFCTTRNGGLGGIWMAGNGIAADSKGFIYCSVGNGVFSANQTLVGRSYGMCYLKLSTPNLKVVSWFAPFDEAVQSHADNDLGNSGLVVIPNSNRIFGGATKFGSTFLMDTNHLGGFTPSGPDHVLSRLDNICSKDNVGQNPVVWDNGAYSDIYLWPSNSEITEFRYDPTVENLNPNGIFSSTNGITAGGSLAVTSNSKENGILWAVGNNSVIYALDALSIASPPLWSSSLVAKDALPSVGHFQFPTVVNGKLYVPSGNATIEVYGLSN